MVKAKPFEISKQLVWEAYRRIRANRGAAGVDGMSLEAFEKDLKGNLYKVWNRMSSGSYLPPPVRLVEIPKSGGGFRPLGIPTVADRIAQTVVKMVLEPKVEPQFHPDSYGYRPSKSALEAVSVARQRCWQADWVIDLDIKAFFDSLDHELVLRAVAHHTDNPWVRLYIARWLRAPLQMPDGTLVERTRGTPQGGVITPPTQVTNFAAGTPVRGLVARGRATRSGRSVDDRSTIFVELHARNERPDQLTALLPVQTFQSFANLIGELAQPTDYSCQFDGLFELRLGLGEFFAGALDAGANAVASRNEVFKIDSTRLVGITKAAERVLLGHEQLLGLISLRAQLGDGPIGGSALRPLLEHVGRIFHDAKNRFPHITIELVDADLGVMAHAPTCRAPRFLRTAS